MRRWVGAQRPQVGGGGDAEDSVEVGVEVALVVKAVLQGRLAELHPRFEHPFDPVDPEVDQVLARGQAVGLLEAADQPVAVDPVAPGQFVEPELFGGMALQMLPDGGDRIVCSVGGGDRVAGKQQWSEKCEELRFQRSGFLHDQAGAEPVETPDRPGIVDTGVGKKGPGVAETASEPVGIEVQDPVAADRPAA